MDDDLQNRVKELEAEVKYLHECSVVNTRCFAYISEYMEHDRQAAHDKSTVVDTLQQLMEYADAIVDDRELIEE